MSSLRSPPEQQVKASLESHTLELELNGTTGAFSRQISSPVQTLTTRPSEQNAEVKEAAADPARATGGGAAANKAKDCTPSGMPLKEAMSDPVLAMHRSRKKKMNPVMSLPVIDPIEAPWPSAIMELLGSAPREALGREAYRVPPATEGLRLACGTSQIPHPRKAASGGEDSLFVCAHGSAAGVADGVGEWEWRFGLNPRAFADELMIGASVAAQCTLHDASLSAKDRVDALLSQGYATTRSFGSSTAIVAAMDAAGSKLGVANIGDSGLRHVRWQPSSYTDVGGTRIVNRTVDQQHEFNCPFQLSRLPRREDFRRLRDEGKGKLVRAVEKNPNARQDMPCDADFYTMDVQEGDLILLGSDGVFDNLHDHEVCHLLDMATSPLDAQRTSGGVAFTDPTNLAQAVAQAARCRSLDTSAKTPFSQNAAEAGLYHVGGKVDDVTVVAAWVMRPPP